MNIIALMEEKDYTDIDDITIADLKELGEIITDNMSIGTLFKTIEILYEEAKEEEKMTFKNEQLNHMNKIEKLTENGIEIYENGNGAVFVNHNDEIELYEIICNYIDHYDCIILKDWNYIAPAKNDYEIIQILI